MRSAAFATWIGIVSVVEVVGVMVAEPAAAADGPLKP